MPSSLGTQHHYRERPPVVFSIQRTPCHWECTHTETVQPTPSETEHWRLNTYILNIPQQQEIDPKNPLACSSFCGEVNAFLGRYYMIPQWIPILFRCQHFSNARIRGFEFATSRNYWDTCDDFLDDNLPFWHFQ